MEYQDIFYFSWRDKKCLDEVILSKVRDQKVVDSGSCPQHSVSAVLEMQYWRKMKREGKEVEKKQIDVSDMFRRYSNYQNSSHLTDGSSTRKLLSWLETNVSRAKDGSEVCQLKGYKDLRPLERMTDLACMLEYLFMDGPFVGVFYVKDDLDRGGNSEIYFCDGAQLYFSLNKPMRHSVAIVGFGMDRHMNLFWEYMESMQPSVTTPNGCGFGRVIVTGLDRAFLVYV